MNKRIKTHGFTLIELLVVIAIIGILSAIIFTNFTDARTDARDKAMRSEFRETQLAIEVYKAQFEQYPAALTDLVPEFIAETPNAADSANTSCAISYNVDAANQAYYKLTGVNCIGGAITAPTDEFARCPDYCGTCPATAGNAAFDESIAVYSSGGECL